MWVKISSPLLLLGSDVDEIWNASSAIDDIISHYKGNPFCLKISWNRAYVDGCLSTESSLSKRLVLINERKCRLLACYDKFFWYTSEEFVDSPEPYYNSPN